MCEPTGRGGPATSICEERVDRQFQCGTRRIGRRAALGMGVCLALGFGASRCDAGATPGRRSLGGGWRAGAGAADGCPPGDKPMMVWPMDPESSTVGSGSRLDKVLLLRLDPEGFETPHSGGRCWRRPVVCSSWAVPTTGTSAPSMPRTARFFENSAPGRGFIPGRRQAIHSGAIGVGGRCSPHAGAAESRTAVGVPRRAARRLGLGLRRRLGRCHTCPRSAVCRNSRPTVAEARASRDV